MSEFDPIESVSQKVERIWTNLVPDECSRIKSLEAQREVTDRIAKSLHGPKSAEARREIGFHLTDWMGDAAFLLALHLYPGEFTEAEIDAGVGCFLVHSPAHVIAAARLSDESTDDLFDEGAAADLD